MKHLLLAFACSIAASLYVFADQNSAPTSVGAANQTTFACTASSALAFTGNKERAYILIENEDAANTAIVKFGSAIASSEGVLLQPKQMYEPHPALKGAIYCKSATGATIAIVEGLK